MLQDPRMHWIQELRKACCCTHQYRLVATWRLDMVYFENVTPGLVRARGPFRYSGSTADMRRKHHTSTTNLGCSHLSLEPLFGKACTRVQEG